MFHYSTRFFPACLLLVPVCIRINSFDLLFFGAVISMELSGMASEFAGNERVISVEMAVCEGARAYVCLCVRGKIFSFIRFNERII